MASFRRAIDLEKDLLKDLNGQAKDLLAVQNMPPHDLAFNAQNMLRKLKESVRSIQDALAQWRGHIRDLPNKVERAEANQLLDDYSALPDGYALSIAETRRVTNDLEDTLAQTAPPRADHARHSSSGSDSNRELQVQLPKWTLPTFDGNLQKWNSFWQSFEPAIHDRPLPSTQKMSYLLTHLKGDALASVQGYSLTNENYEIVVSLLKRRYGDATVLANKLQAEFLRLSPARNNLKSLRTLAEAVERICVQLQELGKPTDNELTATLIKSKLPKEVNTKLTEKEVEQGRSWSASTLREKLLEMLLVRERVELANEDQEGSEEVKKAQQNPKNKHHFTERDVRESKMFSTQTRQKRPVYEDCLFCGKKHKAHLCKTYAGPDTRKKRLAEMHRCWRCLREGHRIEDCPTTRTCFRCKDTHHSLICTEESPKKAVSWKDKAPQKKFSGMAVATHHRPDESVFKPNGDSLELSEEVLLMAKHVPVSHDGAMEPEEQVVAFFDSGSQTSFVSKKLARRLRLRKVGESDLDIYTFNSQRPIRLRSPRYLLEVHCTDGTRESLVLTSTDHITESIRYLDKSTGIEKVQEEKPDILVGAGDLARFLLHLESLESGLLRYETRIGSLWCGRTGRTDNSPSATMMAIGQDSRISMPEVPPMKDFWSLQTIGITDESDSSSDEAAAWAHFRANVRRNSEGRYIVKLPWKPGMKEHLRDHYFLAFHRTENSFRRYQHRPELLQQCDDRVKDQLENDIVEPAVRNGSGFECFLPLHPVIADKGFEIKMRLVGDGSAEDRKGPTLNECLYIGADTIADLAGLLLRLRMPRIVVMCDIEKAFLMIEIDPEDREATKFLWRRDKNRLFSAENSQVLRFCRLAFGLVCSPFLLGATLRYHLSQFMEQVAREMESNLYVDNLLLGAETAEEAADKCLTAKRILAGAKMNLREFVSNDAQSLSSLSEEDRLSTTTPKALGVSWNTEVDTLTVKFPTKGTGKECPENSVTSVIKLPTRRSVLKEVASIYDPLGVVGPAILPGKVFYQQLWRSPRDWDEELTMEEVEEWDKVTPWRGATITFPRRATSSGATHSLHVFVDASKLAYSAGVYLLSESAEGKECNLIYARNRLTPLKGLTIPRAELMAILLGVRVLTFARTQLGVPIEEEYMWSDSQIALHWVGSEQPQPTYIANRLREIRANSKCEFRYISTDINPADLSTRGCSPEELQVNSLWWHGPPFLVLHKSAWPETLIIPKIIGAVLAAATTRRSKKAEPTVSTLGSARLLSWQGVLGALNVMFTGLHSRIRRDPLEGQFSSEDGFRRLELILLRYAQREHPPEEEDRARWNMFLDSEGLLRVQTRLANSEASRDLRQPIFVPHSKWLTLLMVYLHRKLLHAGVDATVTLFLVQFWTPQARRQARSALRKCLHCQRLRAVPYCLPSMPALPSDRVVRLRPFQSVGIDYLGPTLARHEGELKKVWIVLITCLCTRCVHLEAVQDMTARTLVHVFRRFIARRGVPERVLSDNGTQFILLSKTLEGMQEEREESEQWNSVIRDPLLLDPLAREGIQWRRIPQLAPWAGGVYERLVALAKRAFRATLGRRILTWEDMITFVTEVEAIMNQRPITSVSDDSNAPVPLRPVDFLQPQASLDEGAWPFNTKRTGKLSTSAQLAKWWKKSTATLESFWLRWRTEYLLMLRARGQTRHRGPRLQNHQPPAVGDVVIVEDEKEGLPRSSWRLAQVVAVPQGPIRAVTLRLAHGKIMQRPVSMLYALEGSIPEEASDGQEIEQAARPPKKSPPGRVEEPATPREEGQEPPRQEVDQGTSREEESPEMPQEEESQAPSQEEIVARRIQPMRSSKMHALGLLPIVIAFCLISVVDAGLWGGLIGRSSTQNPTQKGCGQCRADCSRHGLMLTASSDIDKVVACCTDAECKVLPVWEKGSIELRKQLLLQTYQCDLEWWNPHQSNPWRSNISCPGWDECELLECYLCLEAVLNPRCHPILIGFGLGILAMVSIACSCCVLSSTRTYLANMAFGIRCICCPLRSLIRWSRNKAQARSWRSAPRWYASTHVAIVTCLLAQASSMALMAKDESCVRSSNGTVTCLVSEVTQLTLIPHNQPVLLLLRDPENRGVGSIKLTLERLTLHCNPKSEGWTRSHKMNIETSHRCPGRGSCSGEVCSQITTGSRIPELTEYAKYPGNLFCTPSCEGMKCPGLGCGHLFAPSCLFYYVYAAPLSNQTYEIWSCPTWSLKIDVLVEVHDGVEVGRARFKLIPGFETTWRNITLTAFAGATAPAPILSSYFISNGETVVALNHLPQELFCSTEKQAQSLDCQVSSNACHTCHKTSANNITCECTERNWSGPFEDDRRRLPLSFGAHTLRNKEKEIWMDNLQQPVQISLRIRELKMVRHQDGARCTITPKSLHGCYNCVGGANFTYEVVSEFGEVAAQVDCEGTPFTVSCNATSRSAWEMLSLTSAAVSLGCKVSTVGGSSAFMLQGQLDYVPGSLQITYHSQKSEEQISAEESLFDFLRGIRESLQSLKSGAKNFLLALPMIFSLLAAGVCGMIVIYLAVKLALIWRLWRGIMRLAGLFILLQPIMGFFLPVMGSFQPAMGTFPRPGGPPPRSGSWRERAQFQNDIVSLRALAVATGPPPHRQKIRAGFRSLLIDIAKSGCMDQDSKVIDRRMIIDQTPPWPRRLRWAKLRSSRAYISLGNGLSSQFAMMAPRTIRFDEYARQRNAVSTTLNGKSDHELWEEVLREASLEFKFQTAHLGSRNFKLEPSGISRRAAGGLHLYGQTTVEGYYRQKHGLPLRQPWLPCLEVRGGLRRKDGRRHISFYPVELIDLVPRAERAIEQAPDGAMIELEEAEAVHDCRESRDSSTHENESGPYRARRTGGAPMARRNQSTNSRLRESVMVLFNGQRESSRPTRLVIDLQNQEKKEAAVKFGRMVPKGRLAITFMLFCYLAAGCYGQSYAFAHTGSYQPIKGQGQTVPAGGGINTQLTSRGNQLTSAMAANLPPELSANTASEILPEEEDQDIIGQAMLVAEMMDLTEEEGGAPILDPSGVTAEKEATPASAKPLEGANPPEAVGTARGSTRFPKATVALTTTVKPPTKEDKAKILAAAAKEARKEAKIKAKAPMVPKSQPPHVDPSITSPPLTISVPAVTAKSADPDNAQLKPIAQSIVGRPTRLNSAEYRAAAVQALEKKRELHQRPLLKRRQAFFGDDFRMPKPLSVQGEKEPQVPVPLPAPVDPIPQVAGSSRQVQLDPVAPMQANLITCKRFLHQEATGEDCKLILNAIVYVLRDKPLTQVQREAIGGLGKSLEKTYGNKGGQPHTKKGYQPPNKKGRKH